MFERRYFIVAQNFHGTTLLSKLLNDHPEVVSLGDTYPSNRIDQVCGCGRCVSECPFWAAVSDAVDAERYRDHPHLLPDYPRTIGDRVDRVLYNGLGPKVLQRVIPACARAGFARDFEAFEAAVREHSGRPEATVFVDGVKSISRVYALMASGLRVDGVIHLYRGPGDYIKSTMKQKGPSWRVFLSRMAKYRLFHRLARRTAEHVPYMSLTYEGLADSPEETLKALFGFLGVGPRSVAELVAEKKEQPWHFMGNASLFHFDGTIRLSRHELTPRERLMVRLLGGRYDPERLHLRSAP
ncbi:hypothetical protein V6X02_04295 [Spiribacter sp. 1M153]|uniref:hypothetical protein n=1 Tax=Spiribacter roseus TaxID=1855875 RepID=UPI00349F47B0